MPELVIDGQQIQAAREIKIIEAAAQAGIEIPNLCYARDYEHYTSCMICLVEETSSGRLLPACSTAVANGMAIATASPRVIAARRAALRLLLSDHVGDCQAPCQRICPAHLDIPAMNRQIKSGRLDQAIITIKETIALPAVLGRICPAPCEKGCRRKEYDQAISICTLKRYVADHDRRDPYLAPVASATGKSIAIVGAGPAGIAAAYYLARLGYHCEVFDNRKLPGGMLAYAVAPAKLPASVLAAEIDIVRSTGTVFNQQVQVGVDVTLTQLAATYSAVIIATGALDADARAQLGLNAAGIETTASGIKTEAPFTTSVADIFAIGNAIRPARMAIRSLAHGKDAARYIDSLLRGTPVAEEISCPSQLGRLQPEEIAQLCKGYPVAGRVDSDPNSPENEQQQQAANEAERCLHCDCRKLQQCKLKKYAADYRIRQTVGPRKPLLRDLDHPQVVYEPGKCIRCGLCIRITQKTVEPLGLTFIGRGFEVRVGAALGATLAEALQHSARECIEYCPVGALAWK